MATARGEAAAQAIWTFPGNVVIDSPASDDFLTGYSAEGSMTIVVWAFSGRSWRLHVRAADPDMGGSGKPVSDVYWRTQSGSTWRPLSTSYVPMAEGSGFTFVTIHFRVRLAWATDQAGSYAAPLEFDIRSG